MGNYWRPLDLSGRSGAPPCWNPRGRKGSFICLLPGFAFTESRWDLNFQCMYLRQKSCNINIQILPYFFRPEEKQVFQVHLHCSKAIAPHSPFSLDVIMLQFKSEAAEPNEMDQRKRTLQPQDTGVAPHKSVLRGRLIALFGLPGWSLCFGFLTFFFFLPLPPKSVPTPPSFFRNVWCSSVLQTQLRVRGKKTSISHFVHFLLQKRKSSLIFSTVLIPS